MTTPTPLTAAFPGMSRAERSAKAKAQLRDRFGRWIEMGGLARFRVSAPGGGQGTWYHGIVTGQDLQTGKVTVRLEDGRQVTVPNSKMEQPKAVIKLPGDTSAPAPATPARSGYSSVRDQAVAVGVQRPTADRVDATLRSLYDHYGIQPDLVEAKTGDAFASIVLGQRGVTLRLNGPRINDAALITRSGDEGNIVSRNVEGLITHEYGHLLASTAPAGWSDGDRRAYDAETFQQISDAYFGGSSSDTLSAMRSLSSYAGTNPDELTAELFAAYHVLPDQPDWLKAWGVRNDNLFTGAAEKPAAPQPPSPMDGPSMRQLVAQLSAAQVQQKLLELQRSPLSSHTSREAYVELLASMMDRAPSFKIPPSVMDKLTEINRFYGGDGNWTKLSEVIPKRGAVGRDAGPDHSVPDPFPAAPAPNTPPPAAPQAPRQTPATGNAVVTGPPPDPKAWRLRVRPKRGVAPTFDGPDGVLNEMHARDPNLRLEAWARSGSAIGVGPDGTRYLFHHGSGEVTPWDELDDVTKQSWEGKLTPVTVPPLTAAAEQPDHSAGAMIALPVPPGTAARLAHPDGLPPSDLHVTLAYLGPANALTSTQRQGVHEAAREAANVSYPLPATMPAGSGTFNNPDEQPYWFDPGCPAIHGLRESLMRALEARGLDHLVAQDHPFTPHITIRYLSPDEAPPTDAATPAPSPATFTHLNVVLGDELPTSYPLGGRDVTVPPPPAPLRISPRTELALSRAVELHNRTAPLGHRASLEAVKAVYSRAQSSPDSRVSSFLSALTDRSSHPDSDLFPASFTPTQLGRALALSREHGADEVHSLVVTASAYPATDPLRVFHLVRALAASASPALPTRTRAALAPCLRALIADGNSAAARSLRAKRQLRDRFGKWIEMGGGIRFKVRSPGSPGGGTWYHGKVEGIDVPNGQVDVRLEDGSLVRVPAKKVEQPKAILKLPGAPAEPDPGLDPHAPEVTPQPVDKPTQATLPPSPIGDVIGAADSSGQELFKRVPTHSTASSKRDSLISGVDTLMNDLSSGTLTNEQVIQGLHQVAESSNAYSLSSQGMSPEERDAFRSYADDVLDVAAGIDPSHDYAPAPTPVTAKHVTSSSAVDALVNGKYDVSLSSGQGHVFGPGVYLAKDDATAKFYEGDNTETLNVTFDSNLKLAKADVAPNAFPLAVTRKVADSAGLRPEFEKAWNGGATDPGIALHSVLSKAGYDGFDLTVTGEPTKHGVGGNQLVIFDPKKLTFSRQDTAPSSSPSTDPLSGLHTAAEDLAATVPEGTPLHEKLAALSNTLGQLLLQKDTLPPEDRTKTLKALDGFIDKTLDEHLSELGPDGENALTDIQSVIVQAIHPPKSKSKSKVEAVLPGSDTTLKGMPDEVIAQMIAEAVAKAPPLAKLISEVNAKIGKGGVPSSYDLNQSYKNEVELRKIVEDIVPLVDEQLARLGFKTGVSEPYDFARWDPVSGPKIVKNPSSKITPEQWDKYRDQYVGNDAGTLSKNAELRSGNPGVGAKSWGTRMSAMVNAEMAQGDSKVYRGGAFNAEFISGLKPGAVMKDLGIMSTDDDPGTALFYAKTRHDKSPGTTIVVFEIMVPKGTPMADVAYGEFVLDRGTEMRIREVTRDDNGIIRVRTEVNGAEHQAADGGGTGQKVVDGGGPAGGAATTNDLLGNPVPDGLATLQGERTLPNGTKVQDYTIAPSAPGAKDAFSVVVGEKNGTPVYALRQAYGAHQPVGNFSSWGEVSKAVDDARGVKSTADEKAAQEKQAKADALQKKINQHEALKIKNVDDSGRPLPDGWSRDITPEGQTVYTGPGRYRAVNADDTPNGSSDLILLVRMPNDTFSTVGDFRDWLALAAGVKKDQVAQAEGHREQLATWLEGHGFAPQTAGKIRTLPSVDQAQVAISQDPQFYKIVDAGGVADSADLPTPEQKQAIKDMTELKTLLNGLQPIPSTPPPSPPASSKFSGDALDAIDEFIDFANTPPELNKAIDAFISTGDASQLLAAGPDGQFMGYQLQNFVKTHENSLSSTVADELNALAQDMINVTSAPGTGAPPASATTTTTTTTTTTDLATPQHDVTSWTLVSGQKGYNQGGTYQAPDGQQYYVKVPSSPAHAHNEVLTSALYRRLGVPSAEVTIGTYGPDKQLRIVSKIVPGAKTDLSERLQDKVYLEKIQSGLAIDAWLANWDVVGPKYDNIVSDANGDPVRIDGGGALLFRGAGGKKNTLFGNEANEIATLRSFATAPKPSKVYGAMGEADVKESVKRLLAITPEDITAIVESTGFDANLKVELAAKLTSRREFLLKKYGLLGPTANESDQTVTKLADVKLNDPVQQPAAAGKVRIAADGVTQLEIGMKVVSTKDGTTGVVFKHDPSDKYVKVKRDSDGKVIARATKTLLPTDATPAPAMTAPAAPAKSPLEPPFSPSFPPVKKAAKKITGKKAATAPQPQPQLAPWELELLGAFEPATPPATPDLATTSTWMIAGKAAKKGDEVYAYYGSTSSWHKAYVDDAENGALYLSETPGGPIDKVAFTPDEVAWPNTIEAKKTQDASFKTGDVLPGFSYPDTGGVIKVGDEVKLNNGDPNGQVLKVIGYGIDPTYGDNYVKLVDGTGTQVNAMSVIKSTGGATATEAPKPVTLGPGYATLDPHAVPMYVNKQTKGVIVVEPAGAVNHYDKYGAVSASWGKLSNYGKNPNWDPWAPDSAPAPAPAPSTAPAPTLPSGPPPGVQSVLAGDGNLIYPGVQVMGADGAIGVVKSIEPNGAYVKVKFPSGTKARAVSKLKLISGGQQPVSPPAKVPAKPVVPVAAPQNLPDGSLDGAGLGGTANISQAVSYVTASPENAVHGISIATDSGDVEDLNVRVMRVKVDGQERLLLKFKLTSQAGDLLAGQQAQQGTWKKRPWKVNKFSRSPGELLSTNSMNAGVDAAAGGKGQLVTLDLDNGAHIEHRTGQVRSLHNSVEIYLPVDADETTIRQSLLAAGVRTPGNATQQDVNAFIENRMISMLDNFSDPTKNKEGADRQASLDRIAKRYGVTAESFTVEHGPGGRIDVVAPQELRDQLATQTGVQALVHNVSVKGASLTGAASAEDKGQRYLDFLERFFTDRKGLRSTVNRWTEGVVTNGMSSSQDMNTGGADYVFFRPYGSGLPDVGSTSSGYHESSPGHPPSVSIMTDPRETIFRNLAWNANSGDSYGKRLGGDILARTDKFAHEIMPKDSVAWEQVHSVRISKWYRDALVDRLKKRGITMIGGRTVEQFFASDNEPIIPAPGLPTAPGTALPPAVPGLPAGEGVVTP